MMLEYKIDSLLTGTATPLPRPPNAAGRVTALVIGRYIFDEGSQETEAER